MNYYKNAALFFLLGISVLLLYERDIDRSDAFRYGPLAAAGTVLESFALTILSLGIGLFFSLRDCMRKPSKEVGETERHAGGLSESMRTEENKLIGETWNPRFLGNTRKRDLVLEAEMRAHSKNTLFENHPAPH